MLRAFPKAARGPCGAVSAELNGGAMFAGSAREVNIRVRRINMEGSGVCGEWWDWHYSNEWGGVLNDREILFYPACQDVAEKRRVLTIRGAMILLVCTVRVWGMVVAARLIE